VNNEKFPNPAAFRFAEASRLIARHRNPPTPDEVVFTSEIEALATAVGNPPRKAAFRFAAAVKLIRAATLVAMLAFLASAQISAPHIGLVRDRAQALRPLQGVAGAFVLGEPVLTGVVSAASAGRFTLAKTATEVVVIDGTEVVERREAPEGMASFGFDLHGKPSWVRFEINNLCETWGEKKCSNEAIEAVPGEPVGDGWTSVRTQGGLYLMRGEQKFQLPEVEL